MSLILARKKRANLYLGIAGLLVMVAAVSAISARDPSGASLRVGMVMVTVGAGLTLPWRQLIPAVVLAWIGPNLGRSLVEDTALLNLNLALEFLGLSAIACFTTLAQQALRGLEEESAFVGAGGGDIAGLNVETGIFYANQLRPALQAELARARRFRRTFSLVLVDIDEMRQKFDYRDEISWKSSLGATTRVLRETRHNVDRVFHYRDNGFAMIHPEASENDIVGLVKRLRRIARSMKPTEGEPGGPIPVHFGATFFPDCATTVDDLLVRAEVALRIAAGNSTRYQLDSAEASGLPPLESMRRDRGEGEVIGDAPVVSVTPEPPSVSDPVVATVAGGTDVARALETGFPWADLDGPGEASSLSADGLDGQPEPAPVVPTQAIEIKTDAAAEPEPRPATTVATETPTPQADSETPEQVAGPEDLESLLAQMDETLEMIRSARSRAA
jgi:diguanylate cyclase (GGDEF)-like protein